MIKPLVIMNMGEDNIKLSEIKNQFVIHTGYELIESGIFDFDDWAEQISETLSHEFEDIQISPDCDSHRAWLETIWNSKFSVGNQTKKLSEWAAEIAAKHPQQEMQNSVDKLFEMMKWYKDSRFLKNMIKFAANFKTLGAYNSMLVKTQMPEARYVLTESQWRNKYKRKHKDNARPLVTLNKFGPISWVFEIGDTERINKNCDIDLFGGLCYQNDSEVQRILDNLARPYLTTFPIKDKYYNNLVENLRYCGIRLEKFRVGSSFAANIRRYNDNDSINIDNKEVSAGVFFKLSVNDRADNSEQFASICHELGHLFCHHLIAPKTGGKEWWKFRKLTHEEEEFEAEIVSYIVCERYNVGNRSWEYLENFLDKNGGSPNISYHYVFKAADYVEQLVEMVNIKNGLLYKHDEEFRKIVKPLLKDFEKEENTMS